MKYYVKLALITLVVSVAAAEIFGPLVGLRGYIGPAIMGLFDGDGEPSAQPKNASQLELAGSSISTATDVPAALAASAAAQKFTAETAFESCVSALKSVSLHPEFAKVPVVPAQIENSVYAFAWPSATPTSAMDTSGNERNVTAACRIGEDGRLRTLIIDDRELFSDTSGRDSVIGGWRIGRAISKVDRSTNVTVSTRVTTPVVINDEEITPTLVLHCGENKTVSYVKLGSAVGSGKLLVTSTIDGKQQKLNWSISTDGNSIYQGSRYITLLRELAESSLYSLSFAPNSQETVTLNFDLGGLKAAINPLQEACHWR